MYRLLILLIDFFTFEGCFARLYTFVCQDCTLLCDKIVQLTLG